MSCKNDQDWEGSYVYKTYCVQWTDLVALREKFNEFLDLLKKEEKEDGVKYGYRTETDNSAKEQTTHDLATINGFCSVRFNEAGNYDEIYFKITSGSILSRLEGLSSQYSYANPVGGQAANYGPWIVYLKDPCYGCTGYRFQNRNIPYGRTIVCNDQSIEIDPSTWKAQCIWTLSGGCDASSGATVISDWQQYCHFNFDWRSSYAQKFGNVAKELFAQGPICVPKDDPCTVSRNYCCNEYALAHYTEEYMDNWSCPENETAIAGGATSLSELPYRMRRLKWVSLGVNLTNPKDEEQPFDDDTFFCCNNSITGGVFEGHVTQKISAIHLTDMWDRVNTMVGGKPLRKCFYNQCKYYQEEDKKYRWLHKQSVPMYAAGTTPDMMDRKETCENCDKTSVGANICACNFNDINALLGEYLAMECSCEGESKYKGESLISVGSVTDCNCCKTKCCCDCECLDDITQEECLKKSCKKNGPKWLGVYEKGDSVDDKKMGDNKPCGCFEGGDEPDPKFPDVTCMEICGKEAACCYDNNGSCCETLTKCDCDDKKGTFHGFRASDGSYKSTQWKKGDPKNCSDEDIQEIPDCGRTSACCNTETCICDQKTKCACDEAPFVWQGLTSDGQSKPCDDPSVEDKVECGAKGACCGKCYCYEDTKCNCTNSKGYWKGVGSVCDDWEADTNCAGAPGACCGLDDNDEPFCSQLTLCECTEYFKGEGSECDDFESDPNCKKGCPEGACCYEYCSCNNESGIGDLCTPDDGCWCDNFCYTQCNDCCDFASAKACCSGFNIPSLFDEVLDHTTSVNILVDNVVAELHKVYQNYSFVTIGFDLLLLGSIYLYDSESIKMSNYARYVYLQHLVELRQLFIDKNEKVSEVELDLFFEKAAQTNFYYAQLYRKANGDEALEKDLEIDFTQQVEKVSQELRRLNLV